MRSSHLKDEATYAEDILIVGFLSRETGKELLVVVVGCWKSGLCCDDDERKVLWFVVVVGPLYTHR